MNNCKYEVAFSLLDEDKEIARQINNLIKNKFNTYVYFENKEKTAPQNGLNFSRIVVEIYVTD